MARVPLSIVPDIQPAATPPEDYQRIPSSPASFGALIGGAEQKAGQEAGQASGNLFGIAERQQERYNEHVVTDSVNKLQSRAEALTYGDKSNPTAPPGLYTLKGEDAMRAGPQVSQQINQLRDQIAGGLNDAQKLTFEQQTQRYLQYKRAEIANHINQETDRYGLAANTAGIATAATMAGNAWNSDEAISHSLQDAVYNADKNTLLHYGHPPDQAAASKEEIDAFNNLTAQNQMLARTHVIKATVDGAMASDPLNGPARASQVLDKFGGLIDPVTRSELMRQAKSGAEASRGGGIVNGIFNSAQGVGVPLPPAAIGRESKSRADAVRDGLISRGLGPDTATAFAANALHESDANPYTGPGDGGASHGLFMWRDDRLAAFKASHNGLLPEQTSLDTQLDFAMSELRGKEASAMVGINQAVGPGAKAAAVSTLYLRPKDVSGEEQRRGATAIQLASATPSGALTATSPTGEPTQTGAQPYNPAAYDIEAQMLQEGYRQAEQAYPGRPDLQQRYVIEPLRQRINEMNTLEAKRDAAALKAKRDAQDGVMNSVITTLRENPDKFDPKVIDNPLLTPEQRENLSKFSEWALTHAGIEDTAPYGKGYAKAYRDIFAPTDSPDKISEASQLAARGGPGGDLSFAGVEKLNRILQLSKKSMDQNTIHQTALGFINDAKSYLSFEEDTGPVKIRDPAGEHIFNAIFLPQFEFGLDAAVATGDPQKIRDYLSEKNVTAMYRGMRSESDKARDRLISTGQTSPADVEKPGMPLPPVPEGVNPREWANIMSAPPVAENGVPFTHGAWASVLQRLLQNPENGPADFDAWFHRPGQGEELLRRLKSTADEDVLKAAGITSYNYGEPAPRTPEPIHATAPNPELEAALNTPVNRRTHAQSAIITKDSDEKWNRMLDNLPKDGLDALLSTQEGREQAAAAENAFKEMSRVSKEAAEQAAVGIWNALLLPFQATPHRHLPPGQGQP